MLPNAKFVRSVNCSLLSSRCIAAVYREVVTGSTNAQRHALLCRYLAECRRCQAWCCKLDLSLPRKCRAVWMNHPTTMTKKDVEDQWTCSMQRMLCFSAVCELEWISRLISWMPGLAFHFSGVTRRRGRFSHKCLVQARQLPSASHSQRSVSCSLGKLPSPSQCCNPPPPLAFSLVFPSLARLHRRRHCQTIVVATSLWSSLFSWFQDTVRCVLELKISNQSTLRHATLYITQ